MHPVYLQLRPMPYCNLSLETNSHRWCTTHMQYFLSSISRALGTLTVLAAMMLDRFFLASWEPLPAGRKLGPCEGVMTRVIRNWSVTQAATKTAKKILCLHIRGQKNPEDPDYDRRQGYSVKWPTTEVWPVLKCMACPQDNSLIFVTAYPLSAVALRANRP